MKRPSENEGTDELGTEAVRSALPGRRRRASQQLSDGQQNGARQTIAAEAWHSAIQNIGLCLK
jgi:hypothetical protein